LVDDMDMEQDERPGRGGRRDRGGSGGGGGSGGDRDSSGWRHKPRRCQFCTEGGRGIDYKDAETLRRFLSDRGKIRPRRQTGACARHQRQLAQAIKRARQLALLPYTAGHIRGA